MLVSRSSAREIKYTTGGEGAVFGAEPSDHGGGFFHFAETAHGDLREHVVDVLLGALFQDVRDDDGGGDAVHADVGLREFFPEGFR